MGFPLNYVDIYLLLLYNSVKGVMNVREKSFGSQLCKNMKKHGVSSKGMSEMTGINESDILLWMNGKAMPSLEQASKLSDALGIPVHELTSYSPEVRFHGIDEYTEEEKQAMAEKISADRERQYKQGKTLVILLVVLEIIGTAISMLFVMDLLWLALMIVSFVLIFKGVPWARYMYIFYALRCTVLFFCFLEISYFTDPFFYFEMIPYVVHFIGGMLLAFNSSVKEYLYSRYAG